MEHHGNPVTAFLFHALNFALLVGLIVYLYLKKGRTAVADAIANIDAAHREANQKLAQANAELAEARANRSHTDGRIREFRKSAQEEEARLAAKLLADARATSDHLIRDASLHAQAVVQKSRDAVLQEIGARLYESAQDEARKALTPDRLSRLEDGILDKLPGHEKLRSAINA